MDIREAWQIMKAFGDYETFDSTLLYWPMLPPKTGKQQPYYRFDVVKPHEELVYVGAWTKKATKSLGSGGLGNLSVLGAGAGDVVRRVGNVVEGEKFLVGGKENCVVVAQEINWGHWESLVPHKPLPNTLSFIIWRDR